jgi:hypothetical protein
MEIPAPAERVWQLIWSGSFTPDGVSEEEAVKLFRGIYHEGLTALAGYAFS